jgi:prepilin-type N-terminal cleavage/methylation domain-containing protein
MQRRRSTRGFTLIEVAIAILILLLLLTVAVPSVSGVMADRRLRRSLDELNVFVRTAQKRAVAERRPYLIAWGKDQLLLRPEFFHEDEDEKAIASFPLRRGEALQLHLPAALVKEAPAEWAFWPTGTCEPAVISFKSPDGEWSATYSSLTARGELTVYAPR